jgi:hypothetical protein
MTNPESPETPSPAAPAPAPEAQPKETGGRKEGLEATRYNTWEKNGREIDF